MRKIGYFHRVGGFGWRGLRTWCLAGLGICLVPALAAGAVEEKAVNFEEIGFRVVTLEPAEVRLVWQGEAGRPLRSFDRVQKHLSGEGKKALFLMNAGIFEPGGIPSGLHIEGGKVLRKVNPRDGIGNFFLKPNGVLLWGGPEGGAQIMNSRGLTRARLASGPRYGLQSGPLLLLAGKIHPAFRKGSPNLKHRNGAGIDKDGKLVFAMTAKGQETNLHTFARLFLKLGCEDALFLDGDISQMAVNPKGVVESNRFGAVLVVTGDSQASSP
jgi:uncharacterized protein YigE (DUF2233 family)